MRLASLLVLCSLAAAVPASAGPPGATPPTSSARRKSPELAGGLTLGLAAASVAAVGIGVFAADDDNAARRTALVVGAIGLVLGPSVGHWYVGRTNIGGIALRTGILVMMMGGIASSEDPSSAESMFFAGSAIWLGSVLHDTWTASTGATAWNREHGLTVAPTMIPATGGRAPGVAMSLRF